MKKRILLLSAVTSIFMNLSNAEVSDFKNQSRKKAKDIRFDLYPTKISKVKKKDCWQFENECLLPLTKKPVLTLENFEYQKVDGKDAGIQVFLDKKSAKSLMKVSKDYLNNRLAFVHNGEILYAPVVKSILEDGDFKLTFRSDQKFKQVLETFR
jgi:preprotein translocase subunit SecD